MTSRALAVVVLTETGSHALPEGLLHEALGALRATGLPLECVVVSASSRMGEAPPPDTVIEGVPVRRIARPGAVDDTTLFRTALQQTTAPLLLLLPAVPRVAAESLPLLLERVLGGAGMAVARRHPRRAPWLSRFRDAIFHALLPGPHRFHDLGCGVAVLGRAVLDRVPLYGAFLRFLPVLAAREGELVVEVEVPQHPADRGWSGHGPAGYLGRLLDLTDLFFLSRFTERPFRFFGLLGIVPTLAGVVILILLLWERLAGHPIGDRPLLLLGMLLFVVGIQIMALGLVAEILVFLHARSTATRGYRIRSPQA